MTVTALKELVMRQLGEDVDDVLERAALLDVYLERGYQLIMDKRKGGNLTGVKALATENLLPDWAHSAIADYATYRILLTGNGTKQQRAQAFYASYGETLSKLLTEADEAALTEAEANTGVRSLGFKNLYT